MSPESGLICVYGLIAAKGGNSLGGRWFREQNDASRCNAPERAPQTRDSIEMDQPAHAARGCCASWRGGRGFVSINVGEDPGCLQLHSLSEPSQRAPSAVLSRPECQDDGSHELRKSARAWYDCS